MLSSLLTLFPCRIWVVVCLPLIGSWLSIVFVSTSPSSSLFLPPILAFPVVSPVSASIASSSASSAFFLPAVPGSSGSLTVVFDRRWFEGVAVRKKLILSGNLISF